jgi:hypothetical protein
MFDIHQLLDKVNIKYSHKKYKDVYEKLKPYIINKITTFLDKRKTSKRGRPREIKWDQFLECLFYVSDNGLKISYIKKFFNISKSTYYSYLKLFSESKLFEQIYSEIVLTYSLKYPIEYLMTDTFTVKSMDGSEGVGRNPTDRGRKGIKVSLICDQNLVSHAIHLEKANIHDSKILIPTIGNSISDLNGLRCLADSGYAGSHYISKIKHETGVSLISKPKRTCNKLKMSHTISADEMLLLNEKRNGIERLNGNIRRFRGLMIKYTKKIASYRTYLFIAIMCITCYNIFTL